MSNNIMITPVARAIPFDNTTGKGYSSTNAQTALEELRDHTVYNSETNATTASGTLTLTSSNTNLQFLTGTASGYSVKLPDATTIPVSSLYQAVNTTSQTVSIKDSAGTVLFSLSQNSIGYCYLRLNGTAAGTWVFWQVLASSTASGIISYNIVSSTVFSTSSSSDTQITSFVVTPEAGTYGIWFSSSASIGKNNAIASCTIYSGSTAITDSLRQLTGVSSSFITTMSSQTIFQFNGTDQCRVYVKQSSGTLTLNQRSLLLTRLGT